MKILIVVGADYIGSHMVLLLRAQFHEVIVLDKLSSGHAETVPEDYLVTGNIADIALLDRLFTDQRFEAVMHFASFIQVAESVEKPAKYYGNNVVNTINLLDAMVRHGVDRFVFSSTAGDWERKLARG